MIRKTLANFSPGRLILLSFFLTICLGTLFLALPMCRKAPIGFTDLIFTATSSACVTGLFTLPLDLFTWWGHLVVLFLIQIGGLGLITLTLFIMTLFLELGMTTSLMAGQILELESWKNIEKTILLIICLTLCAETLGALLLFPSMYSQFPLYKAIFYSVFHSVSSFCNAGIFLFHGSLIPFSNHYLLLFTIMLLMFIGGFGFIPWHELVLYFKTYNHKKRHHFSLHTKIIMYTTAITITISTLLIWMLEQNNAFSHMSGPLTWVNSLFHAIGFRSTGVLTVHIADFQLATILLMMVSAFIGSSPGSTGSGIKITTFTIFLATIYTAISGRSAVNMKGRRIPKELVNKAIAVVSLSAMWVLVITFCLLITERSFDFIDILLESVSAFTNLGISAGITHAFTTLGKVFIMASMIVGRIGSLTLMLALRKLAMGKKHESLEVAYPDERVMLS